MNTPICDFVREYSQMSPIRMHMPGHKGKQLVGPESLDITEIEGADVLYHAEGIIRESRENAAEIFGTAATFYSTEGSSLCIRAMLFLMKMLTKRRSRRPVIAAGRNAHKTFIMTAALLDIEVDWIYADEPSPISCEIGPEKLERVLSAKRHDAVYITSPDYLGNVSDVAALSEVCHRHGCVLLADNAHGAYLKFLPDGSRHPIDLGADMCCDSAHKTLPVLTGGAYLHISKQAPKLFLEKAEEALKMFASTSPSYLIMQSLDAANRVMAERYGAEIPKIAARTKALKDALRAAGYTLKGDEPLKITIQAKPYGYTGEELSRKMMAAGIFCEFSDPDYLVMMVSSETKESELEAVEKVLKNIPKLPAIEKEPPRVVPGEAGIALGEAVLGKSERIPVSEAEGRILAAADVACPPAIPIAVCGERITREAIACFEYYGINEVTVII